MNKKFIYAGVVAIIVVFWLLVRSSPSPQQRLINQISAMEAEINNRQYEAFCGNLTPGLAATLASHFTSSNSCELMLSDLLTSQNTSGYYVRQYLNSPPTSAVKINGKSATIDASTAITNQPVIISMQRLGSRVWRVSAVSYEGNSY